MTCKGIILAGGSGTRVIPPTVGVQWPVGAEPKLADKDAAGKMFAEADYFD